MKIHHLINVMRICLVETRMLNMNGLLHFFARSDVWIGLALLICRFVALDLQHVLLNRGIAWFKKLPGTGHSAMAGLHRLKGNFS